MRFAIITIMFFTSIAWGADQWESLSFVLAGDYEVIGKRYETGELFTGSISIDEVKPNSFVVTRIINGKTIKGKGQVEYATADKVPVFRIYFVENGTKMEGTLLWRGDLDNEGRISGYIYPKGYQGNQPGLEALFAKK